MLTAMRALLITMLGLAAQFGASPSIAQSSGSLSAGNSTFTLQHDGRSRSYIVHVPPAAATGGRELPVMIAFHGGGGEAAGFQAYAGLDAIADREGFLTVYPYGSGRLPRRLLTWNAGECCGYAMNNRIDDVGFAVAVLDDVMRRTAVDTRRIYAIGHSNGSMMAYRLAAERSDRIVAIVAVSGAYDLERFAPSNKVSVLDIHSVDDPRAPYNGGQGPAFPGSRVTSSHRSVMEGIQRWVSHDGCKSPPRVTETRTGAAGSINAGQTATLLVWDGCANGVEVAQWKLTATGHGWPGNKSAGFSADIVGPPTTLITAAEEGWKFVSRLHR